MPSMLVALLTARPAEPATVHLTGLLTLCPRTADHCPPPSDTELCRISLLPSGVIQTHLRLDQPRRFLETGSGGGRVASAAWVLAVLRALGHRVEPERGREPSVALRLTGASIETTCVHHLRAPSLPLLCRLRSLVEASPHAAPQSWVPASYLQAPPSLPQRTPFVLDCCSQN